VFTEALYEPLGADQTYGSAIEDFPLGVHVKECSEVVTKAQSRPLTDI